MSLGTTGYVLEPIRCGQSNGTFTQTPDNYISNQAAFDAAYAPSETAPRTDYLVLVTSEGTTRPGLLESARFGYTKNEVIDRFAYDAQAGGFRLLRGAAPIEVGVLTAKSNETRLRVRSPAQAGLLDTPYRLSVGSTGSGTAWNVTIVANDAAFGNPSAGSVELSKETGNLHWNNDQDTGDLTRYAGQRVRFQQQQFFLPKDTLGRLGTAPINPSDPALMLNPLPGPGQLPRLRLGYGFFLTSVEVADEAALALSNPSLGTVHWARDTGSLKFNSADATANVGVPVYYDGVMFAVNLSLPTQSLGLIATPTSITGLPPTGVDLIFSVGGASPYYRFPTVIYRAAASFDATGKKGEVQVDPATGQVGFSVADRIAYAGKTITLYFGDLPIERGISIRLLRNPVNLDAALAVKDVTRIYTVSGATWADPIIAAPQVSLPSLPIDNIGYPMVVRVMQGQGSYVSDNFSDLDTTSPPAGLGYYIDFDQGTLFFAQRKEHELVQVQGTTSDIVLPDPLLIQSNLSLEIETGPGTNVYAPLTVGDDVLVDTTSGVVSLTSTNTAVVTGVASVTWPWPKPDQLTDPQAHFVADGVQAGYLVVIADSVYTVAAVVSDTLLQLDPALDEPIASVTYTVYERREVLADRYFDEVVLLDPSTKVERLRTLEVARTLTPKVDYQLQPELGLVQFADRMLTGEEARITYTVAPPSTMPATKPGAPITEYARFLIRKELTQAHTTPTSTLSFNKAGLQVASNPAPAVFRGGRPQKLGTQCTVDVALSLITFLPDAQITDALPHGATINPNERVYIDYYVTQAVGGEKTFTVLQSPLLTAVVTISDVDADGGPNNRFVVQGDQTARFPGGHLMRIETEQVYLIGTSSYDAEQNQTTVVLYDSGARQPEEPSQVFQDTYNDPKVYVSSGPTPITSAALTPAYFAEEQQAYEAVARGSNTFLLVGDQTLSYRAGTVVLFTDSSGTFTDFLQVSGAGYDATTARTTVMLAANAIRQYVHGGQLLLRSVRPIFEPPLTEVRTSRAPKLTQPYRVYRKTSGRAGEIVPPSAYTIDDTGRIVFATPLGPLEEFSILYTGLMIPNGGVYLRASYTSQITPSATNGLLGQTLLADYYIRSPDSFYFRVEPMTNFRGEYAAEIANSASSGSSGPQTSNASQPKLWEQGRKSLYFDERHLANQDLIARSWLLINNNLINLLEDYRRQTSGIVVGNNDGKFLFDGIVGRVVPPVTNQIDDRIKISNAPYTISGPPFQVTSIGTYRTFYAASPLSRFYPTAKSFFGVSAVQGTTVEGDEILDTGATNVTGVSNVRLRQPWAIVTEASTYSGSSTLNVDDANGDLANVRPGFANGMVVIVKNQDGTVVSASGTSVTSFSATLITLSVALTGTAQVGATVYRDPADSALLRHTFGRDYGLNGELGQLTYVASDPGPPANKPFVANEAVSGSLTFMNPSTAPSKFPALYGGIEDDDGDLSFPIQTPARNSEQSYLATEDRVIRLSAGLIRANTSASFETGTGTVASSTTFTSTGTVPSWSLGDLIRITSGANANMTRFRKVTSLSGQVVSVTGPALTGGSFTYEATVSGSVVVGTVPLTPSSTSTTVHTSTNVTGAKVGHTLVFTSGALINTRTQITSVSGAFVTVAPVLASAPLAGVQFRVDNPVATYGGSGAGHYLAELDSALSGLAGVYADEAATLAAAISHSGLTGDSAQVIADLRAEIQGLLNEVLALDALLNSNAVYSTALSSSLSNEFVTGLTTSIMDARATAVAIRIAQLPDIKDQVSAILASTDQLYDKRYVWIDARINLENGLLVQQETAVKNRLKAQADAVKQLTKLIAVGGT